MSNKCSAFISSSSITIYLRELSCFVLSYHITTSTGFCPTKMSNQVATTVISYMNFLYGLLAPFINLVNDVFILNVHAHAIDIFDLTEAPQTLTFFFCQGMAKIAAALKHCTIRSIDLVGQSTF